jgi:general secretion pathway protein A
MDRNGAAAGVDRNGPRPGWGDEVLLPSRAGALAALRDALEARTGPLALTGAPGAGKTWLLRRLRDVLHGPYRWASVDLSPAVGAVELYRLVLHALGLEPVGGTADMRAAAADFLTDRSADGERWVLCAEEGHAATAAALEELRVLAHRLGEPGAFSGLVLAGQNPLARRLKTQPLAPLSARLAGRVHLRPITVDELQRWVDRAGVGQGLGREAVERLHRDLAGNPRDLRDRLGRLAPQPAPIPTRKPVTEPVPAWPAAPVAPARPPLAVGEGMIEVGWESGPESVELGDRTETVALDEREAGPTADSAPADDVPPVSEEAIEDRYAALQAWTEWARNQGRDPVAAEASVGDEGEAVRDVPEAESPSPSPPGVRAEGQHEFAPYSQLFTRLRQSRDPR